MYETVILPLRLDGCVMRSLTQRKEDTRYMRTGCWGEYFD